MLLHIPRAHYTGRMEQDAYDAQFETILQSQEGIIISDYRMAQLEAAADPILYTAVVEKKRAEMMARLYTSPSQFEFAQGELRRAIKAYARAVLDVLTRYSLNDDSGAEVVALCLEDYEARTNV